MTLARKIVSQIIDEHTNTPAQPPRSRFSFNRKNQRWNRCWRLDARSQSSLAHSSVSTGGQNNLCGLDEQVQQLQSGYSLRWYLAGRPFHTVLRGKSTKPTPNHLYTDPVRFLQDSHTTIDQERNIWCRSYLRWLNLLSKEMRTVMRLSHINLSTLFHWHTHQPSQWMNSHNISVWKSSPGTTKKPRPDWTLTD